MDKKTIKAMLEDCEKFEGEGMTLIRLDEALTRLKKLADHSWVELGAKGGTAKYLKHGSEAMKEMARKRWEGHVKKTEKVLPFILS